MKMYRRTSESKYLYTDSENKYLNIIKGSCALEVDVSSLFSYTISDLNNTFLLSNFLFKVIMSDSLCLYRKGPYIFYFKNEADCLLWRLKYGL